MRFGDSGSPGSGFSEVNLIVCPDRPLGVA